MADNVSIDEGAGAKVIASDDVGGVQYQKIKVDVGGDGVSVPLSVNSGATDAGTVRVIHATDDPLINAVNATDPQIGATNEAAAASDTAASGLNGLIKRALQHLTNVLSGITNLSQETAVGTASWPGPGTGTVFSVDMQNYGSISVWIEAVGVGTLTFQTSEDNVNWFSATGINTASVGSTTTSSTTGAAGVLYKFPKYGRYFRVQVTAYTSGTFTARGTLHRSPFTAVVQAHVQNNQTVAGPTSHDGTATQNPVRVAARAREYNAPYAAVSADDVADISTTRTGEVRVINENSFNNITTNATTVVKSGAGVLHTLTINTKGTGSTATVYDNTAGSGTKIATIDTSLDTTSLQFDCAFGTGLTIVTAGTGAADITVTYK